MLKLFTGQDFQEERGEKTFVKSFIVNDISCVNYLDLMNRVSDLCDELQEGNYSALLERVTEFETL